MGYRISPFTDEFDNDGFSTLSLASFFIKKDQSTPQTLLGSFKTNFLTSGRALFAGTDGILDDDSAFKWDNTNKGLMLGANTTTARGYFDIDDIQEIDVVPNIGGVQTASGNINYVSTDYIEFNVYAYRTLASGAKIYSQLSFGPSATPSATPTPYKVVLTWDAVSGAEGYIVEQSGQLTGYTAGKWKDVGNVLTITYGDGSESSWSNPPATVTPSSPYGADVYIDKVTGNIISYQGFRGEDLFLDNSAKDRTGRMYFTQDSTNDAWGYWILTPDTTTSAGCVLQMGGTNGYSFEFTADHRLLLVGTTGSNVAIFATEGTDTPISFRTGGNNWGTNPDTFTINGDGYGVTIGDSEAGVDYTLTFDGETNNGIITWMEDEDYFQFADDILLPDNEALKLGTGVDASLLYDGTDLVLDTALVGSGVLKLANTTNWTANGTATVTISNVAPAGVGTATISKWLTVKDNAGTVYYIPAWT